MPAVSAIVVPLLIYWLVFFMACYTVCEVFQDWFYDEVLATGWRVGLGSFVLAALATWIRPTYDTMLTGGFAWTLLQGVAWFLVFVFVLEFHPWHALAISPVVMVMVAGLTTMGVESITTPSRTLAPVRARPGNEPIRKSLGGPPSQSPAPAPAAR